MPDPQRYSDLPPGASIVHDPAQAPQYSDLPPGAKVVTAPSSPQSPEQPGFFSRLGQSFGVPTSGEEAAANAPQNWKELAADPLGTTKMGLGVLSNVKAGEDALQKAIATKQISPETLRAMPGFGALMGGTAENVAKDIQAKNYPGAAGGTVGMFTQAALPELLERGGPVISKLGQSAKVLATPPAKMALEAAKDIPIVKGVLRGAKSFQDVPGQMRDIWGGGGTIPAPAVNPLERPLVPGASAAPAEATQPLPSTAADPSTVPRTPSGEAVLNNALTSLDNKNLLKIARSRGIDVSAEAQLKPGIANGRLVSKIMNDFSTDELLDARDKGLEMSRNTPVGTTTTPEAWTYKVMQTFFPEVSIPKALQARAQAAIANRATEATGGNIVDLLKQSIEMAQKGK